LTGTRAGKAKDAHGHLSSSFARYLILHSDDWFSKLKLSETTEDIKSVQRRTPWPEAYRNWNITATRNFFFMIVQVSYEIPDVKFGPMVDRYKRVYQLAPGSGTIFGGTIKGKTAEIRIEQLTKFKLALNARPDLYRDFKTVLIEKYSTLTSRIGQAIKETDTVEEESEPDIQEQPVEKPAGRGAKR